MSVRKSGNLLDSIPRPPNTTVPHRELTLRLGLSSDGARHELNPVD